MGRKNDKHHPLSVYNEWDRKIAEQGSAARLARDQAAGRRLTPEEKKALEEAQGRAKERQRRNRGGH